MKIKTYEPVKGIRDLWLAHSWAPFAWGVGETEKQAIEALKAYLARRRWRN